MSGIGAELPPHLLAKRKRQREESAKIEDASASGAKDNAASSISEAPDKRRRVVGPSMPPAPIEQMPQHRPGVRQGFDEDGEHDIEPESDSDDDNFGPAAPVAQVANDSAPSDGNTRVTQAVESLSGGLVDCEEEGKRNAKMQRDEWMMIPPTQDGLAARMDPLKQRPRGFKGAKDSHSGGGDNSIWHETPEQKQKRLQDEMMGVAKPPSASTASTTARKRASHAVSKETNAKQERGPSLLELHQQRTKPEDIEDDPSKRAFDREKDMGSNARISASQKREMLGKASSNFHSRFSGGSFL